MKSVSYQHITPLIHTDIQKNCLNICLKNHEILLRRHCSTASCQSSSLEITIEDLSILPQQPTEQIKICQTEWLALTSFNTLKYFVDFGLANFPEKTDTKFIFTLEGKNFLNLTLKLLPYLECQMHKFCIMINLIFHTNK